MISGFRLPCKAIFVNHLRRILPPDDKKTPRRLSEVPLLLFFEIELFGNCVTVFDLDRNSILHLVFERFNL